jgi:hypothetical protein
MNMIERLVGFFVLALYNTKTHGLISSLAGFKGGEDSGIH